MFLASIIPPTRKSKVIACLVIISFVTSFLYTYIPDISNLSERIKTIILTMLISSIAAIFFPKKDKEENK